jgi:hypothetical protein
MKTTTSCQKVYRKVMYNYPTDYVYTVYKNGAKKVLGNTPLVLYFCRTRINIHIQWNLDLSFFKGVEKTNMNMGKRLIRKTTFF